MSQCTLTATSTWRRSTLEAPSRTRSSVSTPNYVLGWGEDFIEAKDGEREYVGGGSGKDVASVDLIDRVMRSCDTIYLS